MTKQLEDVWEEIKNQRDELLLQIHLAEVDLREELESLEPKWLEVQENFKGIKSETEEAAQEVKHALYVIADELTIAYQKIKTRLHDES